MQQFAACPFGGLLEAIALQLANLSCFAVHEPERLWEFAPSAEQSCNLLSLLRAGIIRREE